MNYLKDKYANFVKENDKQFYIKTKENKYNKNRVNKEFKDIKILRCQEYANYCYFMSS